MSNTENERAEDLAEELRKARIELEKSQAVVDALTNALVRMGEGRRVETPKATQSKPPKPPEPLPGPRSPFYEYDEDMSFKDCLIEFKDIWVGVIKFFIGPRKRTPAPEPKDGW